VKITWKKVKGAEGYIVYFGTKKGKLKKAATVKGNKKLTYTKKNVKAKKYYVEVKAYVTYNGKKYMSE
jgi:mannan endo-1,4-beta-mannosidase